MSLQNKFFKYNLKLLGNLLLILGLIFFLAAIYLIWQRNDPNRLAFNNYNGTFINTPIINPPVRVSIQNLNIDLTLFPATAKNGQWDTTTQGASYLISSALPGDKGNSVIYAHNWASLFGPLIYIKPGMNIEIVYKNKLTRTFVVKSTYIVSKDQTSVLQPTNDHRLTLYTCTGFLDSQRIVAIAILSKSI